MGFGNGSQNEIGSIRNLIQHLEKDLAAQRSMNNELRTALHQSRFRRGMVLLLNPNSYLNETSLKTCFEYIMEVLYNIAKTT